MNLFQRFRDMISRAESEAQSVIADVEGMLAPTPDHPLLNDVKALLVQEIEAHLSGQAESLTAIANDVLAKLAAKVAPKASVWPAAVTKTPPSPSSPQP